MRFLSGERPRSPSRGARVKFRSKRGLQFAKQIPAKTDYQIPRRTRLRCIDLFGDLRRCEMQRCRKGRQWMTNVLPFAAFSRALRFESSTILGEGPFCRNALRSPGRAIKIPTERDRVKAARNQAWTERNRAWTKRSRAWTKRNRASTKRNRASTKRNRAWTKRNRAWTKRNRVWLRARHEAQSPNVQDHRARTIIVASKHACKPGFACIRLLSVVVCVTGSG